MEKAGWVWSCKRGETNELTFKSIKMEGENNTQIAMVALEAALKLGVSKSAEMLVHNAKIIEKYLIGENELK